MRRPFRLLVLAFLLLSGCELFGPADDAPSAVGLNPGVTFTYLATFAEVDAAGRSVPIYSEEFLVRVLREERAVGPYRDLLHLQAVSTTGDTARTDIWYRESADRLVELAYRNVAATPAVTPKRGAPGPPGRLTLFLPYTLARLIDEGRLPALPSVAADSLVLRDEPRLVYRLPLTDGARWIVLHEPFIQAREVTGTDTVQVAAGTFPCLIIVTRVPVLLPGLLWIDYVAREGLVLRVILNETSRFDGTLRRTIERIELVARSD